MADPKMDSARRLLTEIAHKAVDEKTGTIKAEYDSAVQKVNADIDLIIDRKMADFKLEQAKKEQEHRFNGIVNHKRIAQKEDFGNLIKTLALSSKGMAHVTPEHWTKANEYVRFDASQVGGLLTQEITRDINRKVVEITPILQYVKVRNTASASITESVQTTNITSAYEDELQYSSNATPEESRKVTLTPFKVKTRVAFTEEDLQDSAVDLESFTMESVKISQASRLSTAVMTGNGVKKPLGMVGQLDDYTSGSLTLTAAQIILLTGEIKEQYLKLNPANVGFMMTRQTRAVVRTLSQASNSNLFWEIDGREGYPERLLSYPVIIAAVGDLGAPTNAGAYTSGVRSLGFGNWYQAYSVALREEMFILNDPYSGSAADLLYVTVRSRNDGRPTNLEAAKFLKMST